MYVPQQFREERTEVLVEAIRGIQLAVLVTAGPDGIQASHVPMVLKEREGGLRLETHVARANPHWRSAPAASALAIFQGPQAYVSPSWYESKRRHGKVVPTWAYIAVHATGSLQAVEDEGWLAEHLDDLTRANEGQRPEPWAVGDAPDGFVQALSRGIVGLVLTVDRIEGAWKLNQHRPDDDRAGTIEGLAASPAGQDRAVAEAMRRAEAQRAG